MPSCGQPAGRDGPVGVWPRPLRGTVRGVKWVKRGIMGVALANFVASIWFAQYIITGWLIALYVLGSFAVALVSMTLGEGAGLIRPVEASLGRSRSCWGDRG